MPEPLISPTSGAPMFRDVRPMTLRYKNQTVTFDMPGWYPEGSDEGVHSGDDMKVSDRMLNLMKARYQGQTAVIAHEVVQIGDQDVLQEINRKIHIFSSKTIPA